MGYGYGIVFVDSLLNALTPGVVGVLRYEGAFSVYLDRALATVAAPDGIGGIKIHKIPAFFTSSSVRDS